jgi:hypothetical protein
VCAIGLPTCSSTIDAVVLQVTNGMGTIHAQSRLERDEMRRLIHTCPQSAQQFISKVIQLLAQ